jgi:hypothetical protein
MLGEWIRREVRDAKLRALRSMSVEELRRLWDDVGDDSFSGDYDCADVRLVLNEKGDGEYCAV